MSNLKQQFSDIKKNTPKSVLWLLIGAAVIIVVILVMLLVPGNKKQSVKITNAEKPELVINSEDIQNLQNVTVGETKNATLFINTSGNVPTRVNVTDAVIAVAGINETEIKDMIHVSNTCQAVMVTNQIECTVTIAFTPTTPMESQEVSINMTYGPDAETQPYDEKFTFKVGAIAPAVAQPVVEPEPTAEPMPEPIIFAETEEYPESDLEQEQNTELDEEEAPEVESAEELDYFSAPLPKPEPLYKPSPKQTVPSETEPAPFNLSNACSDFAFPGYNSSGKQIGWVKPEHGAYYFHPFSDKDCTQPTGVYNPDNGIITDINNSGKRIGTDAEHMGYGIITTGKLPNLSNNPAIRNVVKAPSADANYQPTPSTPGSILDQGLKPRQHQAKKYQGSAPKTGRVYSSQPYDREFILRQYKPIPATIVSEVRADPTLYEKDNANGDNNFQLPVRATVDRNVYSDSGRTIIIPTGTLMMGYVTGTIPGPYASVGRMQVKWYQFILPNGVEFNFDKGQDAFTADSQGRVGVPGRGSTDYLEQFVMPMLTAIVPAAVNMIAPVADKFVNQIDLDNNTVVQSGTMRSSELAKNEIITAWNQIAQKLITDAMDNTVPPFSIPAGTRINVYSPADLIVSCGIESKKEKKCALTPTSEKEYSDRRNYQDVFTKVTANLDDGTWRGQARSFALDKYCMENPKTGGKTVVDSITANDAKQKTGYDYATILAYCQASSYQAINSAKQQAYTKDQQTQFQTMYETAYDKDNGLTSNKDYKEKVLGLKYEKVLDEDGNETGAEYIVNPFASSNTDSGSNGGIVCDDGVSPPDANGCCPGETYTDMGEQGFNCCPDAGGDCFPPFEMN